MPSSRLYPGYAPNSDGSVSEDDEDRVHSALHSQPINATANGEEEDDDDLDWKLKPKVLKNGLAGNGSAEPSRKRQRVDGDQAHSGPSSLAPAPVPGPSFPPHAAMPSGTPAHHPIPGLRMKSFFGWQPADEISKVVGEWLLRVCYQLQNVEIEFKLGTLVDKRTNKRLVMQGVKSECVVADIDVAFRSEMTMRQHRTLNSLLNEEVANCSGARGPHPHLAPHSYIPITYTHTYQTDTSFPGPNGRKVRVSRDTDPRKASSEVIAVVQKETVKSLHVYSPRESFDWRVSVNTETPCPMPPSTRGPEMTREKDRLSYKHQAFQIDLTQVKATRRGEPTSTVHELEIEVLSPIDFLTQGHYWTTGQPNSWEDQLECIVNTLRTLNRNSGERE